MSDSKNSERCVLCLDQKRSPVQTQCGHSFCAGCLDDYKSYKKYPWASKCPICREVLKEKKATKRKYSEINVGPASSNNNISAEVENNSSSTSNQSVISPQSTILEEFMTLAAEYDNAGEEDNYMVDLNQHDEEDEISVVFGDDSYEEELNFYTDSEYEDDNDDYYYYGDLDDDYYHYEEDTYHQYDEDEEVENDDNDDVGSYQFDSMLPRDWSSNNLNSNSSEIDWETVIASESGCFYLLMFIAFIILCNVLTYWRLSRP